MELFKEEEQSEVGLLRGNVKKNDKRSKTNTEPNCKFFLRNHPFERNNCPECEKKCYECKGINHFAKSTEYGASNSNHRDIKYRISISEVQKVNNVMK